MKHLITTTALLLLAGSAHAQEPTLDELMRQYQGLSLDDLMAQYASQGLEEIEAAPSTPESEQAGEQALTDLAGLAFDPDETCALYMCALSGFDAISNPTCQDGWKRMFERIASNFLKPPWDWIPPIEPYIPKCVMPGTDPHAQGMLQSESKIITTSEPSPLGVVIVPGNCPEADTPAGVSDVLGDGDCAATLTTYTTLKFGEPVGHLLHVNQKNGKAYIQDTETMVAIPIDEDVDVPPVEHDPVKPPVVKPPVILNAATGDDYAAILADAEEALASMDSWYTYPAGNMNSSQGYHSAAAMMGFAQIYRVTGDKKWLDAGIKMAMKWIGSGSDLNGDGFLDWTGDGSSGALTGYNIEHHEWRAGAGIADLLIEIQASGYEGPPGTEATFTSFLKREVWEKWSPDNPQYGAGHERSNIATNGLAFAGRLGVIAMSLDRQDSSPGQNQYAEYLNSPSKPFGRFFSTVNSLEAERGVAYMPVRTDNTGGYEGKQFYDVTHGGDMMYALSRANQLGYNPQGQMPAMMDSIENMLNTSIFKTSAGFTEYSDGSGGTNNSNWSSAHGWSMTAGISPELKDKWVDFVRNNDPYFYDVPERRLWMDGGLLWALKGGTLS